MINISFSVSNLIENLFFDQIEHVVHYDDKDLLNTQIFSKLNSSKGCLQKKYCPEGDIGTYRREGG